MRNICACGAARSAIVATAFALMCGPSVRAAVTNQLTITAGNGSSQSTGLDNSRNFSANVYYASNTNATAGLSFLLNNILQSGTNTAYANAFQVVSQDSSTGAFQDATPADSSVSSAGWYMNQNGSNLSTYNHGFDIYYGSNTTPVAASSSLTPSLVAKFVINVAPSVPNGTYFLSLSTNSFSNSGQAFDGNFNEVDYTNVPVQGNTPATTSAASSNAILAVVVPEPASMALMSVVAGVSLCRPRRGRKLAIAR